MKKEDVKKVEKRQKPKAKPTKVIVEDKIDGDDMSINSQTWNDGYGFCIDGISGCPCATGHCKDWNRSLKIAAPDLNAGCSNVKDGDQCSGYLEYNATENGHAHEPYWRRHVWCNSEHIKWHDGNECVHGLGEPNWICCSVWRVFCGCTVCSLNNRYNYTVAYEITGI